ncbi:hypothetical protein HOY82DRAFT_635783, partial [Tuber indicum]
PISPNFQTSGPTETRKLRLWYRSASASRFIKVKRIKADMSPAPPPESSFDASPFAPHSPPSPPSLQSQVTHEDYKADTAATIIAVLSLCAIFLALTFLVGYGVYLFGAGFLLGKRVPRKRGRVTENTGLSSLFPALLWYSSLTRGGGGAVGGISVGISGIKGDAHRDEGRGGKKKKERKGEGRSGGLDTVIEVPEGEGQGQGGSGRNRAEGEDVDVEMGRR